MVASGEVGLRGWTPLAHHIPGPMPSGGCLHFSFPSSIVQQVRALAEANHNQPDLFVALISSMGTTDPNPKPFAGECNATPGLVWAGLRANSKESRQLACRGATK